MSVLPIRPDLLGHEPYGAPQADVPVRLNTNENPFRPPPAVRRAITEAMAGAVGDLNRYPDRDARRLRLALAEYVSRQTRTTVGAEMVWAANGSNEIFSQILQLFGSSRRTALGFEPTYSVHRLIAENTGTRYVAIRRRDDFRIGMADAIRGIDEFRPDVVLVCSPNNPTGTSTTLDDLATLYDAVASRPEGILVVDEAYGEFSSHPSAVGLLAGRERLIVARTMSKAFAFAGARVGYLVADPAVVEAMGLVRLPYHLSTLTQVAAVAVLDHARSMQRGVAELRRQRDRIADFARERGLPAAESDANFVLVGGFGDSQTVWRLLLDRGVLVRDVELPGWLRFSAGTAAETTTLLSALSEIIDVPPEPAKRRRHGPHS
ncbi:MAG: histidinol-phosphate transaminase [Candidatus Nanopelagicales bacterium]|nr:histidinol-phosphate transaminase [Candidatus Nanopelagicales bacterium]